MDRPSSSLSDLKSGWGFLWSRRIPPKVKTFGWKLSKNALALMGNLNTKNPEVADICPVCKTQGEDVFHAFIRCPVARQTWALSSLPWALVSSWQGDAAQWFRYIDQKLDGPVLWNPPPAGVIKINCDGATFAKSGMVGVGVVARDFEGRVIERRQRLLEFKASPELAKLIFEKVVEDYSRG
ncbi:hypothetical protein Salat_1909200 [Sesamum alatum]|uniref:Reverse transcriptase zinc-binding domain-containing protein n=1 Tax=Sesamum alatum TaxID=300844 RepID=A0AAE1Y3W2_9LAMI|nr:hypothetical protein Salat_1909200 [Sesamum alatum]